MKQRVREGRVQATGVRGLFTGNFLVVSLNEGEDAEKVAKALDLQYETKEEYEKRLRDEPVVEDVFLNRELLFRDLTKTHG